ncbi:MAG: undecaprenyldiphospho-muramoylpentapeptide beta-N-acetylglucosaminyltransferase [Candidatus Omnitrophota bacterium]
MLKNILIATGGTGGHIYPAIVTAEELRRRGCRIRFIGSFGLAGEKLTSRGFEFVNITAKGFVSKGLWQRGEALIVSIGSFIRCLREIQRFQPEVVIGFGGYSSFPAVIAGSVSGRKTMIHEQNAAPGLANRILGRIVPMVAVSFKQTEVFFRGRKVVWTGYPMRAVPTGLSRDQALAAFGLQIERKTILIFGGSQGSRAINQACLDFFESVNRDLPWQVIHLAGKGQAEGLRARYSRLDFPVYVQDYLENMPQAYAAADLVIARSGAGTVTELGCLGLPAILIPYPYANSHQEANARILADHGAAVIIREKDLNPAMLGDKIFLGLGLLRPALSKEIVFDAVLRLADEVERL